MLRRKDAAILLFFFTLALQVLVATEANAQPADDKVAAEALFQQGKAALEAGRLEEACPKLAESLRLDVGTGTMLYLAECYERQGKTASAWAEFREAQASAARDKDAREKVAKDRADALEAKLSRLTVTVAPENRVEGLTITRDATTVLRPAMWGTPTPIDPGSHVIRASASGFVPWETKVNVASDGATALTITVPRLVQEQRTPAGNTPPIVTSPPVEQPRRGSAQRTIGIGLTGLGAVGIGIGTFLAVRALSALDDSKAECDERACTQNGLDLRARATREGNFATVAFAAGGVALVGGVALWLTAPKSSSAAAASSPSSSSSIAIAITASGLSARGRF